MNRADEIGTLRWKTHKTKENRRRWGKLLKEELNDLAVKTLEFLGVDDPQTWMPERAKELVAELERKWKVGEITDADESALYGGKDYAVDCVWCAVDFTSPLIRTVYDYWEYRCEKLDFNNPNRSFSDPKTPLRSSIDLGGGPGLTTKLIELTLGGNVYYSNLPGLQWDNAVKCLGCTPDPGDIEVDAIFCFEVIEHIKQPVEFLENVINPRLGVGGYFIETISFSIEDCGHHKEFIVDGESYGRKQIRRVFNKKLVKLGFEREWSGWQGRPSVWKKTK